MSYATYPVMKDSGVPWLGQVPVGWEVKRSRFVLTTNPPASKFSPPPDLPVSFVVMDAVGEYGGLRLDVDKPVSEIGSGYTPFSNNDVVVAKITPCFENGKGALADNLTNGMAYGTTELHVLRSSEGLFPQFLFYLTITYPFRKIGESNMYGAGGQKRISEGFIKDFKTAFPPIAEQEAIAEYLDKKTGQIDKLIAKKQALLKLLAEQRTALITHAVTKGLNPAAPMKDSGIEWLGEVPKEWNVKRVSHVTNFRGGSTPSKNNDDFWIGGSTPWVSPKDMKCKEIYETKDHLTDLGVSESSSGIIDPGQVLMVVRSGILRHSIPVAINRVPVTVNQDMRVFKPSNKLLPDYIYWFIEGLQKTLIEFWTKPGTTVESLESEYVSSSKILLPSIVEQKAITAFLDKKTAEIDAIKSKTEQAIERLKEYRTALITNAVTGKIKVG